MANSDKNIKITPNINQSGQPVMVYTGSGNVPIALKVLDDSYGTLSFEGSAGQLFSLNNNLASGTIFGVNDISGMPQFDVNADGTIRVAPYGSGVYMGGVGGGTFNIRPSVKASSGAGTSLAIMAGNGVTSGAGGSLILQAGIQATSGGDGKVIVKQVAGQSAYFFELQNSAGTAFFITSTDANANIFPSFGSASTSRINFVVAMGSNVKLGATHINYSTYASKDYGFATSGSYYWSPVVANTQVEANVDLALNRDAADTLAQRRSTNPQSFRVYNTYTDASNYERLGISWASNICTIGLAQAGTGAVRTLAIAGATATSGAGGNVTITAGSGAGTGAGGNLILQAGLQATSGGDGKVIVKQAVGQTSNIFEVQNSSGTTYESTYIASSVVYKDISTSGSSAPLARLYAGSSEAALFLNGSGRTIKLTANNDVPNLIFTGFGQPTKFYNGASGTTLFISADASTGVVSLPAGGVSDSSTGFKFGHGSSGQTAPYNYSTIVGSYDINSGNLYVNAKAGGANGIQAGHNAELFWVREGNTPRFFVQSIGNSGTKNGFVGIRTESPLGQLHVVAGMNNKPSVITQAKPTNTVTVTNKQLTSNVATLTYSGTGSFKYGEIISVTGVDATFNGIFTVTSATTTTVTYNLVSTDVTSTASSGTITCSQTANLEEWQNSAGTALTYINANGSIYLAPTGTSAGNTNQLRFLELAANGVNSVGFKAADNITADVTWTLPSGDGSTGQALVTNGSGLLSWATAGGGGGTGTVTSISGTGSVNGLTLTGTVTNSGSLTLGGTLSNISLITAVSGILPIANGGTNLSSVGSANQILGVSPTGSVLEYKTLTPGSGISISNTVGSITINSSGLTANGLTIGNGLTGGSFNGSSATTINVNSSGYSNTTTGTTSSYDLGTSSFVKANPSTSGLTINGFSSGGSYDGRNVKLVNVSNYNITIVNTGTTVCVGGNNIVLGSKDAAELILDSGASVWRVF